MRQKTKPDWPEARERFLAFWEGEAVDRCCIAIRAPKHNPRPAFEPPANLEQFWLDPEWNLRRMLAEQEATHYLGEAYPATTMCLGASVMAAFFGAKAELRDDTVWFHPVVDDIAAYDWDRDFRAGKLFRETLDATQYYAREVQGRCCVGLPELGSATDDLSLLRGMQNLVYDMVDSPAPVHRAISILSSAWCRLHGELFDIAKDCNDGGCCIPWMQTWAPGPHFQMACDFSSVLSPKMFEEFILPELQAYLTVNEYSVYHLDGPDAVVHLDALLSLPNLKAIQWTPGDGQLTTGNPRWWPIYHKVQQAGKRLILPFVQPDEVEMLVTNLSSRGLHLSVWCSDEEQARWLLNKVCDWSRPTDLSRTRRAPRACRP